MIPISIQRLLLAVFLEFPFQFGLSITEMFTSYFFTVPVFFQTMWNFLPVWQHRRRRGGHFHRHEYRQQRVSCRFRPRFKPVSFRFGCCGLRSDAPLRIRPRRQQGPPLPLRRSVWGQGRAANHLQRFLLYRWVSRFFNLSQYIRISTWGLQTVNSIDLAQKNRICGVITPSINLHCDIIKAPSVPTLFVHFFLSVQTISTNFGFALERQLVGRSGSSSGYLLSGAPEWPEFESI